MSDAFRWVLSTAVALAGSVACDDSEQTQGESEPSIQVTSPPTRATITEPEPDIAFTVRHFTLKAPGACGGEASCGHVHLLIDGDCSVAGASYNSEGAVSPIAADFARCPEPEGEHTITLELHADDHSAITNAKGDTIRASILVLYRGP